jgi:hypothetical protein
VAPSAVHVDHLTGATLAEAPECCRECTWWQTRTFGKAPDKRRWLKGVEDRFGAWGKLYLDGERTVALLQYGPSDAFPRARDLPAGPVSGDAVVVTCAFLLDVTSPWALQSLFLACIGACHERGVTAIEAFAFVHAAEAEFAERFLNHRTVFPRDFLADYGFRTLRSAGRVELMRLELGGLQPATEDGFVAQAVRRAAEIITGPPPLPAPAS